MDTRISRDTSNSKNALKSRKASNSRTASNKMFERNSRTASKKMFERNSRNANNTIGYTRDVSNSKETSNRKPSGT